MTAEPPEATAERVLDLVRARAGSAEAEVTVQTGTQALTRFANSFIHQNVAEDISHVLLRVAHDGRVAATSYDGPPTDDGLARLVDGVLEAARASRPDAEWPGIAPIVAGVDVHHWDQATADSSPDDRAGRVAAFVAAADGLETAGACETETIVTAFANTAGQRLHGRATTAALDGIVRTATADGSGRAASVRLADLDGGGIGWRAARKARDASDASDLEPGRYEVVLEPNAVADILQFLFVYGFNGRAIEEGRSFVRVGEPQFDTAITLREDPTDPAQAGLGFDVEGTPRLPLDLVRDGVTRGAIHTRRTAAAAGVESTGHAVEGGEGFGALPANPILEAGDRSVDDLIGQVDRGLLVTDFWYTRILDPRTQVVTGLTRNGVWLIQDGRVVRPVSNLRFTQSYLEALAPGAVRGIGADRALVPAGFGGIYLVPMLHLATWNFTGGARG